VADAGTRAGDELPRVTTVDALASAIRARIHDGELAPATAFPSAS
jgi:hypothetical protein